MVVCQYCNSILARQSGLLHHQKTAKYCLEIQGKSTDNFTCSICTKNFSTKYYLAIHQKKCSVGRLRFEKIIDQNDKQIKKLKRESRKKDKTIEHLEEKIDNLEDQVRDLREQLAHEKGVVKGMDKSKPSSITNNYINPRLLKIEIDNIDAFTIDTIQKRIKDGKFTKKMFKRGEPGIIDFIIDATSMENENGIIERSYACTDSSRNKFHRLIESLVGSKEWQADNGAHFLNDVLDQLKEPAGKYYWEMEGKRQELHRLCDEAKGIKRADYEIDLKDYTKKTMNKIEPIHYGIKRSDSRDRDKLFTSLRNKISSAVSV